MADFKTIEKETELCSIDGKTYVAVEYKDGNTSLAEKTATKLIIISGATHTAEKLRYLRIRIEAATPAIQTINSQVLAKIRERYTVADEIKMLRIAPSPETTTWNNYVEDCRSWGLGEKAKLGL